MVDSQKVGRDYAIEVYVQRYELVGDAGSTALQKGVVSLKSRLVSAGQYVEYTLLVTHADQSWEVKKRFSDFSALHELLKRRLPSVPDLPAKSVVRKFSVEYMELRKQLIVAYLKDLTSRRDVMNSPEVWTFFNLQEQSAAFTQASGAAEPMLVAEVHEAAFGIVDFAYDAAEGLLLLGATDISWASRLDTKITNIKLPWESAAPNVPRSQLSLWRQSPSDLRFEMQFLYRYTSGLSCVVLGLTPGEEGMCLAGLSDGNVGVAPLNSEPGVNMSETTLPLLRFTAGVVAIAWVPSNQWVIAASKDNTLKIYDAKRQMVISESTVPALVTAMHCHQASKRLFTGLVTGKVLVWDLSFPVQRICTFPENNDIFGTNRITALDFDSVSKTLFTGYKEGLALFAVMSSGTSHWSRSSGQIRNMVAAPTALAWVSSSREILASFPNGTVGVFDVEKGESTFVIQAHKEDITAMMWLDAPRRLITSSKDKTLKVWDFPSLGKAPLEAGQLFERSPVSVSTSPSLGLGFSPASNATPKGVERTSSPTQDQTAEGNSLEDPVSTRAGAERANSVPEPPAPRPRVQGAPANMIIRQDSSDDDLLGWDR